MRTTLLASLIEAAARNSARGAEAIRLFESGRVYLPVDRDGVGEDGESPGARPAPVREPLILGAVATGQIVPADWRSPGVAADFHALKAVLEQVGGSLGVELTVAPGSEPFLHPGKAGRVEVEGVPVGWIGELHPSVGATAGLGRLVAFEVELSPLIEASPAGWEEFREVPAFPAIERDLAIVVPEAVAAAEVGRVVGEAGGELLEEVRLFDRYTGEQVGEGLCSLGLGIRFRAPDRTLSDAEVDPHWEAIVAAVEEMGGVLRG